MICRRRRLLTGLALLPLLVSCGFHLRGGQPVFDGIPPLMLEARDIALLDLLRQTLRDGGVEVVTDPARARLRLRILAEDRAQRVLSVNTAGKVQEYALFYSLRFVLEGIDGRRRHVEQRIELQRDFAFSGSDVLAKQDEADSLFRQMRREAAIRLLRRLQALEGREGPPRGEG